MAFQTDREHLFRAKYLEPLPKCLVASFNFHLSKGYYGAVVFPSSSLACGAINQSTIYTATGRGGWSVKRPAIRRVSNSARVEGLGGEGVPIHTRSYTVLCAHFSLIILNICMNQGDR